MMFQATILIGYVDLLSCALMIVCYQPISLQHFWLSNNKQIRILTEQGVRIIWNFS